MAKAQRAYGSAPDKDGSPFKVVGWSIIAVLLVVAFTASGELAEKASFAFAAGFVWAVTVQAFQWVRNSGGVFAGEFGGFLSFLVAAAFIVAALLVFVMATLLGV